MATKSPNHCRDDLNGGRGLTGSGWPLNQSQTSCGGQNLSQSMKRWQLFNLLTFWSVFRVLPQHQNRCLVSATPMALTFFRGKELQRHGTSCENLLGIQPVEWTCVDQSALKPSELFVPGAEALNPQISNPLHQVRAVPASLVCCEVAKESI